MAVDVAQAPSPRVGSLDWRRFPDGESLVAIEDQLHDADVALRASLHEPDTMSLVLRFAAATAREFGARRVGMISPCLAYLRQDTRFHRGEAVSAPLFAKFLEGSFDWLVTADPYLHRTAVISLLYRIPAERVATALLLADWMRANVSDAFETTPWKTPRHCDGSCFTERCLPASPGFLWPIVG